MITPQADNRSTKLGAEIVLTIIGLIATCTVVLELFGAISVSTVMTELSYFADRGALTAAAMILGFGLLLPTIGFSIGQHGKGGDSALPWIIAGLVGMAAGLLLSVWGGSSWYGLEGLDLFYALWATGTLLLVTGPFLAILGLLGRWVGRSEWVQRSIEYDRQQKEALRNRFNQKLELQPEVAGAPVTAIANDARPPRQ